MLIHRALSLLLFAAAGVAWAHAGFEPRDVEAGVEVASDLDPARMLTAVFEAD